MNFDQFCEEILNDIDIPGWSPAIISGIRDGEEITCLCLEKEGCNNAPLINMKPYYEKYVEGYLIDEIYNMIMACASEATMNADTFTDIPLNSIQFIFIKDVKH